MNKKKRIKVRFVKYSGNNTIKVKKEVKKMHQRYKKYIKVTTHFLVDCPQSSKFVLDQILFIEPCRPLSKKKSHRVANPIGENKS